MCKGSAQNLVCHNNLTKVTDVMSLRNKSHDLIMLMGQHYDGPSLVVRSLPSLAHRRDLQEIGALPSLLEPEVRVPAEPCSAPRQTGRGNRRPERLGTGLPDLSRTKPWMESRKLGLGPDSPT